MKKSIENNGNIYSDDEKGGIETHSPELYARANKGQKHSSRSVLNLFQSAFKKPADINQQFLDVGCGPGDFTKDDLLPQCLPCRKIVATDVSRGMLEFAAKHNTHPMIEYQLLDIGGDTSGFLREHGHFERVYSFHCLHWANQEAAFSNIASLLKPGGECLLYYPARTPSFLFWKEIVKVQRWSKYREVVNNAIPKTQYMEDKDALICYAEDLLKAAELTAYTCEVLSVVSPKLMSNPEAMLGSVLSTNPIMPLLAAEEKQEFTEEMDQIIRSATMPKKYTEAQMRTFDVYLIHAFKTDL
ncbi:acid methyltransferase, putative [Ixodes scapularis]|uniref:Acid methyltransferase, putative n=1 Tax=Ixodes scapularis TaxID=6945 RepID=B7PM72_IXOSC|nr:acid methyltransferase, putative [Ixodes scapularis]|eukprot:XP_002434870.1 acid methyltransferase, putative [Ixodes scapularis]